MEESEYLKVYELKIPELDGFVDADSGTHGAAGGVISLDEEPCSDDLPITVSATESGSGLADPLPPFRDGAQIQVRKAAALRPYAGVEDPDNNVGSVIGL